MTTLLDEVYERLKLAAHLLFAGGLHVAVGWVAAGLLLHIVAQVVRIRGWTTILRLAQPDAERLRHRDVVVAYFGGSGLNGVLPARAGDLIKFALVRRKLPDASYATLVATAVPESACEAVFGVALVIYCIASGLLPAPAIPGDFLTGDVGVLLARPVVGIVVAGVVLILIGLLVFWLRRQSRELIARLRQGVEIFRRPRQLITGVLSWQFLGRVIRGASILCFLRSFGLPAGVEAALLVMGSQAGARIIPFAPVSAGLRIGLLLTGLIQVSGKPVDAGAVTVYTVGTSALISLTTLLIALIIVGRLLGAKSPRQALRAARQRLHAPGGRRDADAPTNA